MGSLAILALLQILTSYVSLKSKSARRLLGGKPTVLVRDGQPLYENMAKERFNMDNLLAALRQKQISRLADVELAVLETDGKLGLIKRQEAAPGSAKLPPRPEE